MEPASEEGRRACKLQRPNVLLLYDKREDPAELCNVAAEGRYASVIGDLRLQLGVRLQQARFSARPRAARY